jgi:hypothetical protein
MEPFGFDDRAFDGHVIDLSIVVSLLFLVLEVGIGAFDDSEDCDMGGKVAALLRRLTYL